MTAPRMPSGARGRLQGPITKSTGPGPAIQRRPVTVPSTANSCSSTWSRASRRAPVATAASPRRRGRRSGAQAVAGQFAPQGLQYAVEPGRPAADDDQLGIEGEDERGHVVDQALDEAVDGREGLLVALAGLGEHLRDGVLVERSQGSSVVDSRVSGVASRPSRCSAPISPAAPPYPGATVRRSATRHPGSARPAPSPRRRTRSRNPSSARRPPPRSRRSPPGPGT